MQQGADVSARQNKGLGAKDPLLRAGQRKVKANQLNKENAVTPRSQRVFQLTAMTLLPFCVYVLTLFVTTFTFYASPIGVMLTFIVAAGLCLVQYLFCEHCIRKKAPRWKKWIGVFGALAALVGMLVGIGIHYKWMLFYSKYTHMMTYTNVAPLQPALQFEDAGVLHFTSGTTVDRTRALGYRHIRSSSTLCVAPVVSGQMAATDPIVYFAVGTNCCGWRGSFTCDDVGKGGQSGLLMLEPDKLVSPAMEWMVDEYFNFKAVEDAIEMQKSVYAVNIAKNHRLLRWVKDPAEQIDRFRKRGLEAALLSCVGYWVVVSIVVFYWSAAEKLQAKMMALAKGHSGQPGGQV